MAIDWATFSLAEWALMTLAQWDTFLLDPAAAGLRIHTDALAVYRPGAGAGDVFRPGAEAAGVFGPGAEIAEAVQ